MQDNYKKPLKQLLTEPLRVQKKKGYYTFDEFRSVLYKSIIGGQVSPEATVQDIVDHALKWAQKNDDDSQDYVLGVASCLHFLCGEHMKINALDRGFAEMLINTTPPKRFRVGHVAFPALLLLLPKPEYQQKIVLLMPNAERNIAHITTFVPCVDTSEGSETQVPAMATFPLTGEEGRFGYQSFLEKVRRGEESVKIAALAVNFLLWQQSMHDKGEEIIELDAPTRKMGFGKNTKQIIVPKVIGEGYKPKVIRNYEPTGTHASPRTHWRSGHWRQQPHGKKDDQKLKTIWLEPTLING